MRWTYSAELQAGAFQRSNFAVEVTNWTVTGSNRSYSVAGPGSRRIEDDSTSIQYTGAWTTGEGNFSGGSIRSTTSPTSSVSCQYHCPQPHALYLGTRLTFSAPSINLTVDGQPFVENLNRPGEDILVRISLGQFAAGTHTVSCVHAGSSGAAFYFDFFEIAIPTSTLPTIPAALRVTLATDWDTDHSIAIAPERTAWMIYSLGFHGRVNHYVGALWFYELARPGQVYASGTIDFTGTPEFSNVTQVTIGRLGEPPSSNAVLSHVNLMGDTAATIAKAFELELNRGYTAVRAESAGNRLTIYARAMGSDGNNVTIDASPTSGDFYGQPSGATLAGGVDGEWRTDLTSDPRLNRAVADWSRSFFAALNAYGLDVAAAFSMELQHGDPSLAAGIAQRYPNGNAVLLNTPALQTNFSPTSAAFWKKIYEEMAALLSQAGHVPYLQFGEVQWWYFPSDGSGMPFYDVFNKDTFRALYGRDISVITTNTVNPALYPEESSFLPQQIGNFTDLVMAHVRQTHPACRFEVLYPVDVNDTPLNQVINYPTAAWTPATLDCIKTESFTYTLSRNLDLARTTVLHGDTRGFPRTKRSFLVGISDSATAWLKEIDMAQAEALESMVLFALDQFCLIGYAVPLATGLRRSAQQG